jgi:hypothetical protein
MELVILVVRFTSVACKHFTASQTPAYVDRYLCCGMQGSSRAKHAICRKTACSRTSNPATRL